MARTRNDRETDARAPRRLRVPASLAVALLGASATVAVSLGGCEEDPIPDPVDAGQLSKELDDGGIAPDGGQPPTDARIADSPDAQDDKPPVDAALPPPDAYLPPPDAPDQ